MKNLKLRPVCLADELTSKNRNTDALKGERRYFCHDVTSQDRLRADNKLQLVQAEVRAKFRARLLLVNLENGQPVLSMNWVGKINTITQSRCIKGDNVGYKKNTVVSLTNLSPRQTRRLFKGDNSNFVFARGRQELSVLVQTVSSFYREVYNTKRVGFLF